MAEKSRAALVGALALFATSACDRAPPPAEPRQPIRIANPHDEQLKALSPDLQRLGLMRAIRDNGKRCKKVEAGGYQELYRDLSMWVALCSDGRHWGIFIAPNGDTQVRDCAEMRELELPVCRPLSGARAADTVPRKS